MGWYVDAADGDGGVTPFKDKATDKVFKPAISNPDSAKVSFDPLGTEAAWLPTGLQVTIDSAKWQGVDMLSWGDSLNFNQGELFGFTFQNDSPPGGPDARYEAWAYGNTATPFHSYKFYEALRGANRGWHIRGDFEWQMYAVVEYTKDRAPKIVSLQKLFTTLQTGTRTVKATVTDDNPGDPSPAAKGVKSVDLYAKVNSGAFVKTTMTGTEPNFTGTLPAANATDTVQYYIIATDIKNNVSDKSSTNLYTIFKVQNTTLYMYNGRSLPSGNTAAGIGVYYMLKDSTKEKVTYDTWDVKNYGVTDIPTLLNSYRLVNEVSGDGGYADLSKLAGDYLKGATPTNRRAWIFADQDHGFISNYNDTIFADTDPHAVYFGMKALINQDYPGGIKYPWEINVDTSKGIDPVFGFIATKMKKDTVKFWYEPTYETSTTWTNWMDEITPTTDANTTVLFKDNGHANKVVGVKKKAADGSWTTYTMTFDWLGTNFRKDTVGNLHTAAVKYMWIVNAGKVIKNALASLTSVEQVNTIVPVEFALEQNYPNPFNPDTKIQYSVPTQSNVEIGIYNILGQKVSSLVNSVQTAGNYSVTWNGKDSFGKSVASGVYFYQLRAGSHELVKKMMLMK